MSDEEHDGAKPKEGREQVLKVEQAVSGRATCKATGEKIEKGEWRVGMDTWTAGRMATTWQASYEATLG